MKRGNECGKTHLLTDGAIEDQLDRNTTGDTDSLGHGGVTVGITVLDKRAGPGLLGAVLVLDTELVLQHDHVALAGAVLHLTLESGAEGVEGVTAGCDLLVGEEADPAQAGHEAVALVVVGKVGLGGDGPLQVLLVRGGGAQDLLCGLLPRDGGVEVVLGLVAEETNVHEHLDHLGESLVAQGTTDDGLGLGDLVPLAVGGGVTVGVGDEGVAGVDVVGLGGSHEVGAGNAELLAILVELGVVSEGEKNTAAGPRELVTQRVVGALGGRETTAVGEERSDLTTLGVYLGDGLDSVQVVDTLGAEVRKKIHVPI